MTDNEIIKALECHKSKSLVDCEICPLHTKKVGFEKCHIELFDCVFDLINRQKAEIERLQNDYLSMQSTLAKMTVGVEKARTEAIKEFAERLQGNCYRNSYGEGIIFDYEIENLVKEMTEGVKTNEH